MAQLGVFTGARLVSPDKLGRFTLPAVLRNSVPGDPASRAIFITTHENAHCMVGSGTDRIDRIGERLDRAEQLAADRREPFDRFALSRRLYGPGESCPMDKSGRFTLSETLSEVAEFDGDVFFLGVGDFFEMWDPARLEAQSDPAFDYAKAYLRAARRVKAREEAK